MTEEIEAAALVEIVRSIDPAMSVEKLRRWHGAGLLCRPRQVGQGRAGGSRSYYPADVVEPAKTIAVLLKQRRNLEWVGWKLWLMDYPVADRYWRPCLQGLAALWDRITPDIRDILDSDDDNRIGSLLDALRERRADNPVFAAIRKGLGEERFKSAMASLLEMAAGYYEGPSDVDRDSREYREAADRMDLVLGLRRARTDHIDGGPTLLRTEVHFAVGDYLPLLKSIGQNLGAVSWTKFLADLPDDDLNQAKRELVNVLGHVAVLNAVFGAALGPDAFGLRRAAGLREQLSNGNFAIAIVGWAIYRQTPGVADGAEAIQTAMETAGLPVIYNMERVNIYPPSQPAILQKLKQTRQVFPHQEWLDFKNKS